LGGHSNCLTSALIVTVLLFGPATASAQTSSANNQNLSDENLLVALQLPQRACPNHSSSPAATDAAARRAKVSVPITAAAAAVSAAAAATHK
jgi:hypothetical protein